MNSEPIVSIVTDQPRYGAAGIIAEQVFTHVRPPGLRLELVSLHYFIGEHLPLARVATSQYARSVLEVPVRRWVNARAARVSIRLNGGRIHAAGYEYSVVGAASQSLCTLHGLYWLFPNLQGGLSGLANDAYHDVQILGRLRFLRKFDEIIVPSEYTARQAAAMLGLKTTVIHHYADSDRFRPRDRRECRRALGLPEEGFLVLNVSAMGRNKNLTTLNAIADRLPPGAALLKLGAHIPSTHAIHLKRLPSDLYPLVFNAADAYLHTSIYEGFGVPLIEALASGLPVVSSSCATGEEILGPSPLLVNDPFDVKEYLRHLRSLADRQTSQTAATYSLRRARRFDMNSWRQKYEEAYLRVFGN